MAINDTILRLNTDGSCEPVKLAGYPTVTGDLFTPVTDPLTGTIEYQQTDLCVEHAERAPDPETARFHYCDKDGLGSIGLTELINLLATHDTDGDGLPDLEEIVCHKTDPTNPDTDGDGLNDGDEVNNHLTDPLNPDTDGDGLTDGAEVNTHNTNPLNPDTDGGGINDGVEVTNGTDPLNPADDACDLVKTLSTIITISTSASNTGPNYRAWSAPNVLATQLVTTSAGNTGPNYYVIPEATAGCAATDTDFILVSTSASNTGPNYYVLKP